jgi:hypothetical protein
VTTVTTRFKRDQVAHARGRHLVRSVQSGGITGGTSRTTSAASATYLSGLGVFRHGISYTICTYFCYTRKISLYLDSLDIMATSWGWHPYLFISLTHNDMPRIVLRIQMSMMRLAKVIKNKNTL